MSALSFLPVRDDGTPRLNVFIHGYGTIESAASAERLAGRVRDAGLPGRSALLFWQSGSWRAPFAAPLLSIGARLARGRALLGPAALATHTAMLAGLHAASYLRGESRAERLGVTLPAYLRTHAPDLDDLEIHLTGHSLGARVIHHALLHGDWGRARIADITLLAGAADLDEPSWQRGLERINGRIRNAWSRWDWALHITPDLRPRVGLAPLLPGHPRVDNREFSRFGHFDFWRNLGECMRAFDTAGAPA